MLPPADADPKEKGDVPAPAVAPPKRPPVAGADVVVAFWPVALEAGGKLNRLDDIVATRKLIRRTGTETEGLSVVCRWKAVA